MYGTVLIQKRAYTSHLTLGHTQILSADFISTSENMTEERTTSLKVQDLTNQMYSYHQFLALTQRIIPNRGRETNSFLNHIPAESLQISHFPSDFSRPQHRIDVKSSTEEYPY